MSGTGSTSPFERFRILVNRLSNPSDTVLRRTEIQNALLKINEADYSTMDLARAAHELQPTQVSSVSWVVILRNALHKAVEERQMHVASATKLMHLQTVLAMFETARIGQKIHHDISPSKFPEVQCLVDSLHQLDFQYILQLLNFQHGHFEGQLKDLGMIVKGETNERAKRVPGEEVLKRIREEATSKVEEIDGNCFDALEEHDRDVWPRIWDENAKGIDILERYKDTPTHSPSHSHSLSHTSRFHPINRQTMFSIQ